MTSKHIPRFYPQSTLDTSHMLRTGKEQRVRKITLMLS